MIEYLWLIFGQAKCSRKQKVDLDVLAGQLYRLVRGEMFPK